METSEALQPLWPEVVVDWNEQAWLADAHAYGVKHGTREGFDVEALLRCAGSVSLGYLSGLYELARADQHIEALLDNLCVTWERYRAARKASDKADSLRQHGNARRAYARAIGIQEEEN